MRPLARSSLHFEPPRGGAGYYRYVPLEVGGGAEGLSVVVDYDRSSAVVDLGVFGPAGFRGWSGGERDRFVIGRGSATPGYLPGPVEAGEWQVALGLYRVPPGGVTVTVTAEVGPVEPPPPPPPPPVPAAAPLARPPAAPGRRWVAGDFHAHTVHSDGKLTVAGLAAAARAGGLEVLAVTDHNTVSHHPELGPVGARYGVTLVRGQEVTTPDGHANCFGDVGWVDFRRSSDDWLAQAAGAGGIMSLNHPLAGDCSWRRPLEGSPHLVEMWHHTWDRLGRDPIEWWRALGAGMPVGGSDFHRPGDGRPGAPTTWVEVEAGEGPPSEEEVLASLAAGRVALAASPTGPTLVQIGDRVVASGGEAAVLTHEDGRSWTVSGARQGAAATHGVWCLNGPDGRVLAVCVAR